MCMCLLSVFLSVQLKEIIFSANIGSHWMPALLTVLWRIMYSDLLIWQFVLTTRLQHRLQFPDLYFLTLRGSGRISTGIGVRIIGRHMSVLKQNRFLGRRKHAEIGGKRSPPAGISWQRVNKAVLLIIINGPTHHLLCYAKLCKKWVNKCLWSQRNLKYWLMTLS